VALDPIFFNFATGMDEVLVAGMSDVINSGLTWAAPQLRVALSLYVIGNALMMMYGRMDAGGFLHAVVRAMAVVAILKVSNYNYYVRDLFFTDLPNAIAAAMNGPRVSVDSSQQFDALWEAVAHAMAFINGQSMGIAGPINRLAVLFLAGLDLVCIGVCFFIWYVSRVFMAITLCIGPFLIILYLFRGTREYVNQWIGKLVCLTVLQIGTSILTRFVILQISDALMTLDQNPGTSVDEMIINFAGVTGIFFLAALMMFVLPVWLTIGNGASGAVTMVTGMAASVASAAGGVATSTVKGSANLGKRLGQYTGSRT
jgi:type IV secretion system protein VirB6